MYQISRMTMTLSLVLTVLAMLVTPANAQNRVSYKGREFPNFTAKDVVTGEQFSLSDFRGKVVLVDFWATWCKPCVAELPNLRRIYAQHKDAGLVVVSVSLDNRTQALETFLKRNEMPWHHVMEGGGWNTRLAKQYGISSIPRMFVLDHKGVCVSEMARGIALANVVEDAVQKLAEAASAPQPPPVPANLLTPTEAQHLRSRVAASTSTLEAARQPYRVLQADLAGANESIRALEAVLADQAALPQAHDQISALHKQLVDLRYNAFDCGALPFGTVVIPAVPAQFQSAEQAKASLAGLTSAASELSLHVRRRTAAFDLLARQQDRFVEELTGYQGSYEQINAQCTALSEAVNGVSSDTNATVEQERQRLESYVNMLVMTDAQLQDYLLDLSAKVDSIRSTTEQVAEHGKSLKGLHATYNEFVASMHAVNAYLVSRGAESVDPMPQELPAVHAASQLEAQLAVADQAIVAMTGSLVTVSDVPQPQQKAAAAMQQQLTALDGETSIETLARAVLALQDA